MSKSIKMIYQRLIDTVSTEQYRFLYDQFILSSRMTGLVGPRGVGKTTMLLQTIKEKFKDQSVFYFSADHIFFEQKKILEYVEELYSYEGVRVVFIDEVHKYQNWSQELKNIYDGFPDLKIVFSGSSSIDLVRGAYDLSRRAKLYHLPGMSFREYLNFNYQYQLPVIDFNELMKNYAKYDAMLVNTPQMLKRFHDYLRIGFYPFQHEDALNYYEKILSVIDKTIYEDIAGFYNLKTVNLHHFKKILNFLASIPPGKTSAHNIAKNLSIDDKTVLNYLGSLDESGLTRLVYPAEHGNQGLRRPDKIFLNNTNLQYALEGKINSDVELGTVRELFFIQSIINSGKEIFHSKVGDYLVGQFTFEIGGKNKTTKQIRQVEKSYLVKDDILVSSGREIPLILFGFLY